MWMCVVGLYKGSKSWNLAERADLKDLLSYEELKSVLAIVKDRRRAMIIDCVIGKEDGVFSITPMYFYIFLI